MNFIRKFFSKNHTQSSAAHKDVLTIPLTKRQIENGRAVSRRAESAQLVASVGQSVGRQRDLNEDSLLALTTVISGHSGSLPFGLYIIADGMGGHHQGEVASSAAVRVVSSYVMRKFHGYLFGFPKVNLEDAMQDVVREAIDEAQRTVLREAPGSGTTLTIALVLGQQVTIGHVGDSRAYFFYRDGHSELLTRDHTLVRRLEEMGQITQEEAAVHPQRNVVYRAIGQGERLDADVITVPFPPSGTLMLCSDGLWGLVSDGAMELTILESCSLDRACQDLVASANEAGGPDNISVVLAQFYQ